MGKFKNQNLFWNSRPKPMESAIIFPQQTFREVGAGSQESPLSKYWPTIHLTKL